MRQHQRRADVGMPGAESRKSPATLRTRCSQNGGRPVQVAGGEHVVEMVREARPLTVTSTFFGSRATRRVDANTTAWCDAGHGSSDEFAPILHRRRGDVHAGVQIARPQPAWPNGSLASRFSLSNTGRRPARSGRADLGRLALGADEPGHGVSPLAHRTSASASFRTSRNVRSSVAIGGKADVAWAT